VADTHARPHPKLLARLRAIAPDAILHAGDVGSLAVFDDLDAIAPTVAIRGNIDARSAWPDEIVLDVAAGERSLRILLTHIALLGPKLRADVAKRAVAADASMVVCGHSHVPFVGRDRGLDVFNPGSAGPQRFRLPIVLGLMTFAEGALTCEHRDLETGKRWTPGG
jgi:putative phosphoesterase